MVFLNQPALQKTPKFPPNEYKYLEHYAWQFGTVWVVFMRGESGWVDLTSLRKSELKNFLPTAAAHHLFKEAHQPTPGLLN